MALTDKSSSKIGIMLVVFLVLAIILIAFFVGGVDGIMGFIKWFFIILFFVLFFGFVFYIIYFLFFKQHKKDIPYLNWKSYLQSALDNGSDMMGELVLMGDKRHSSKSFMTIKGYLRILAFDGQEYDMFVGKRSTTNIFEDYKIVMLKPNDHSDLIGDVYCYGISLILKYGYYFLNTHMLDVNAIDKHVTSDTYRTLHHELLGDVKGIMDRATGLDPEYIKQRQQEKLLKIPVLSGQQGGNQGNQQ